MSIISVCIPNTNGKNLQIINCKLRNNKVNITRITVSRLYFSHFLQQLLYKIFISINIS